MIAPLRPIINPVMDCGQSNLNKCASDSLEYKLGVVVPPELVPNAAEQKTSY